MNTLPFSLKRDDSPRLRAWSFLRHSSFLIRHFILLLLPLIASAQTGTGPSLIVAGTTTTVGADTFTWIALQPTDPSLLMGKQIAVYRKNGPASSANSYARVAIIEAEADVRTVGSLIVRAGKLGENIGELDSILSELLEEAAPAGSVTTAQKMSALISGAWGNADKMRRILLLARQRPSVALCAGFAHTEKIGGSTTLTYELRDYDRTTNTDLGVLGRVTVDPTSPLVLPAPGAPVELPDTSAKGNLNVSLRWATPNALRDLAPLHHGFDVYRVTKAAALAHGWNATPPATVAALKAEPAAKKVNLLAILTPVMLTAVEAANLSNTTVYVNDDNGRFKTAGTKFNDGVEFYYFAVARDLMGNGGTPSPGTLVQIFDRMPPNAPKKVRVRNVASYVAAVHDQRLMVEWDAPTMEPGKSVSAYYIYRWRTPHEIPGKSTQLDPVTGKPERNLIGIVSGATFSFIDDGNPVPPAWAVNDYTTPTWPTDNGKTWFYTVRAVDNTVAGNISGNSPPVWGVLRDREGPAGANGDLSLKCFAPLLSFTSYTQVPQAGLTADEGHLLFRCTSTLPKGLAWAEFRYTSPTAVTTILGRASFSKGGTGFLESALRKTMRNYTGEGAFACRVATTGGVVSNWGLVTGDQQGSKAPQADHYIEFKWNAVLNTLSLPGISCGWRHQVTDPVTGTMTDLTGTFTPTAGSREWKIYRRVNNSAQSLIAQGEIPAGSVAVITWTDENPPQSNCTVCYYLQLYDEHGNPSPMVQQGECVEIFDATIMPTPMLEPITGVAPMLSGKMKVTWMCSTAGVDRFELWVGRSSGNAPSSTGSGLSTDLVTTHPNNVTGIEGTEGIDFAVFQTSVARHLSPTGTPEFSAELPVSFSDTYTVMVRAVGPGDYGARTMGSFSNVETFHFNYSGFSIAPSVPWPDRPLPPQADFHTGIAAAHLAIGKLAPWKGNAVRIGEYADPAFNANNTTNPLEQQGGSNAAVKVSFNISTQTDVEQHLYTNDAVAVAEPKETIPGLILPVAMYRVQVANSNFPTVSGDIVQVSPLMEKIAQVKSGPNTIVTDSFIAVVHESDSPLTGSATNFDHDIFLLDRQPVIKGATYKYILVRFSPTKEIERVIVTNTVDVPL